jgi:hypothetical protein
MMYEVTKPIVKLEHHPAQKDMAAMVPIGTITVMMPNHKNPPGWVEAYGQRLSKHAYPDAAGAVQASPAQVVATCATLRSVEAVGAGRRVSGARSPRSRTSGVIMTERDLDPREGKVLRYVTTRGSEVRPSMCVVPARAHSDLPKSPLVARAVLERLRAWGFVTRSSRGYEPTPKGRKRVRQADSQGEWRGPCLNAYRGTSRPA